MIHDALVEIDSRSFGYSRSLGLRWPPGAGLGNPWPNADCPSSFGVPLAPPACYPQSCAASTGVCRNSEAVLTRALESSACPGSGATAVWQGHRPR